MDQDLLHTGDIVYISAVGGAIDDAKLHVQGFHDHRVGLVLRSGHASADENVPSLAEVQVALQQCVKDRKVLDAQCEATGEGTEFTCTYSLDGDTPETEREAMIAADGASYVLIDIPEDCQQL